MPGRNISKDYNAIVKDFEGTALRVGLLCPTEVSAGKSHLALQILYHAAHEFPNVACERIFLPAWPERRLGSPPLSRETRRALMEFDLLATSLSFESEYPWFLWMLQQAKIPSLRKDRTKGSMQYPFLLLGGLAVSANPAPLRPVADAIFTGEADFAFHTILQTCLTVPHQSWADQSGLGAIDGILLPNQTKRVKRNWIPSIDATPYPIAQILLPTLQPTERGRTCPHYRIHSCWKLTAGAQIGAGFCLAGHFTRPFRNRSFSVLQSILEAGVEATPTKHVTLIGSAVADYPDLKPLLQFIIGMGLQFSLPSVRLDQLDDNLLALLHENGSRTLTITPKLQMLQCVTQQEKIGRILRSLTWSNE